MNDNNEQPTKCLFPNCASAAHIRGLCAKHYSSAVRFVREGKTTWAILEAAGKSLPAQNAKSWFLS